MKVSYSTTLFQVEACTEVGCGAKSTVANATADGKWEKLTFIKGGQRKKQVNLTCKALLNHAICCKPNKNHT